MDGALASRNRFRAGMECRTRSNRTRRFGSIEKRTGAASANSLEVRSVRPVLYLQRSEAVSSPLCGEREIHPVAETNRKMRKREHDTSCAPFFYPAGVVFLHYSRV